MAEISENHAPNIARLTSVALGAVSSEDEDNFAMSFLKMGVWLGE